MLFFRKKNVVESPRVYYVRHASRQWNLGAVIASSSKKKNASNTAVAAELAEDDETNRNLSFFACLLSYMRIICNVYVHVQCARIGKRKKRDPGANKIKIKLRENCSLSFFDSYRKWGEFTLN